MSVDLFLCWRVGFKKELLGKNYTNIVKLFADSHKRITSVGKQNVMEDMLVEDVIEILTFEVKLCERVTHFVHKSLIRICINHAFARLQHSSFSKRIPIWSWNEKTICFGGVNQALAKAFLRISRAR